MKKSILSTVLLSGLVLSIAAPVAFAAPVDNANTDVEVYLEKEDDGHNEGNGDYFGKLAIVWKPIRFEYAGKTSATQIDMANKMEHRKRNFIAVNDDRRDEATPGNPQESDAPAKGVWKLSGKLNKLTHTFSGKELEAKLTVQDDEHYIYNIGDSFLDGNGDRRYTPLPIPQDLTGETKLTGHAKDSLYEFKPQFSMSANGDAVELIRKSKDDALVEEDERGIYTNLGNNNISILNGTGSDAGMYKGTITWTLEASL